MKYYINIFVSVWFLLSVATSYAAEVTIVAPDGATPLRQPILVQVYLDTEDDAVSGIAGNFSFPSEMFDIESIITEKSIVSLWGVEPSVSEEKYLDRRTHITFEGIFPGGYSGVRSPYYRGKEPGILFSVMLVPKQKGNGSFIVDDIQLHAFDSNATQLPIASAVKLVSVPELLPVTKIVSRDPVGVNKKSLSARITRDPLVNNNAWYLIVEDRDSKYAIEDLYVAETNDYSADTVSASAWHSTKNPYVLFFQNRSKNVHVKFVYSNNTYALMTVPAVENFTSISNISRILVSIIVILSLMYMYGKKTFILFSKK
jgi:hypothetical protein